MNDSLFDRLAGCGNLPTIPGVALEVLTLARSRQSSIDKISAIVARDPALSTRMLRVANSSLFGTPIKATTVKQALVRMGLRSAQSVALSFSVNTKLTKASPDGFDHLAFWRSSLVTAVAAKMIEERTRNRRADEAFTAGLLQDIGVLALNNCLKAEYAPALEAYRRGEREIAEVETELLGANHMEAAGYLLGMWNVPDGILGPISCHHDPASLKSKEPDDSRLARVLQTADAFMRIICYGANQTNTKRCVEMCKHHLAWAPTRIVPFVQDMAPLVLELGKLLSIEVSPEMLAQMGKGEVAEFSVAAIPATV